MPPVASTGTNKGAITTQNVGAPTGDAVTANSTVTAQLGGGFDTAAIAVTGTYTGGLTVQVQLADGTWVSLSGVQSLTNAATGAQSATIASGSQGVWQVDVSGFNAVRVTAILAAVTGTANVVIMGSAGSGVVGIDTPIQIAAGTAAIGTVATPLGSALSVVSTASTNASAPKTSAGNLFEVTVSNPTATAVYVKFYNKASAPTVGTDVPVLTIAVPAAAAGVGEKSFNFGAIGKRFTTGIAMAVTGAAAATDTSNAVAGVQVHGTYV